MAAVSKQRAGFTLIEMMLVVTLMVLLTTIMVPRVAYSYQTMELSATIREISQTVEGATQYAIRYRTEVRMKADTTNGTYTIEQRKQSGLDAQFGKVERGVLSEQKQLPEGMRLDITFPDKTADQTEKAIVFYPDGRRTPSLIQLTDRRQRSRWLKVNPSIGSFEILRKDPNEKQ